jgi:hypothetical protein
MSLVVLFGLGCELGQYVAPISGGFREGTIILVSVSNEVDCLHNVTRMGQHMIGDCSHVYQASSSEPEDFILVVNDPSGHLPGKSGDVVLANLG